MPRTARAADVPSAGLPSRQYMRARSSVRRSLLAHQTGRHAHRLAVPNRRDPDATAALLLDLSFTLSREQEREAGLARNDYFSLWQPEGYTRLAVTESGTNRGRQPGTGDALIEAESRPQRSVAAVGVDRRGGRGSGVEGGSDVDAETAEAGCGGSWRAGSAIRCRARRGGKPGSGAAERASCSATELASAPSRSGPHVAGR
jgi:hypothetical protein